MKIRFIRDTTLWIIHDLFCQPYKEVYKKGDCEYIDVIEETEVFTHVQFENGETSAIPKDAYARAK